MKSKKKVLIVSCVHPPYVSENNGVAVVLKRTYELFGREFDFFVFALGKHEAGILSTEDVLYENIPVRFLHNVKNSQTVFFYRFKEEDYYNKDSEQYFEDYLKQTNPDVVHFHSINGLGANLIDVCKKRKRKVVITVHDFWWICPSIFLVDANDVLIEIEKFGCSNCKYINQINKAFPDKKINKNFKKKRKDYLYKQLQKADEVIVNSKFMRPIYEKIFPKIKYKLINNPVDKPDVIPKLRNPNRHRIIIGFLGGTSNLKGYDTLLSAFAQLKTNENIELHIYGSLKESTRDLIKKLIRKLKSTDEMRLSIKKFFSKGNIVPRNTGGIIINKGVYTKEGKFDVINSMDIVVIPSKARESFSLTTIEAMLMGKYVIVSDSGGQKQLGKKQKHHGIFKTGDTKDLQKELEKAITIISKPKYHSDNSVGLKTVKQYNKEFVDLYREIYLS